MERRNISESDARLLCLIAGLSLGKALQLELEEVNSQKEALFTILDGEALRSIPNILDQAELASKPGQTMETLRWLWHGLRDMLLVTVGCPSNTLVFQDRFLTFKALAEKVSPTIILELIEDLVALEQGIQRNLNMQLGLERFFLRLHDCFYIDPR
jgi:hypothetical protein